MRLPNAQLWANEALRVDRRGGAGFVSRRTLTEDHSGVYLLLRPPTAQGPIRERQRYVRRVRAVTAVPTVIRALAALLDAGLPCFPCHANKRPATPGGYKDATSDPDAVYELWRRYPGPLIGVPTGKISGLDVLDIDPRHGGDTWFVEHEARLPVTRVHQTRGGGLHLFLQHESGLRCSTGRIAAGVDVRAEGGYVIWWPAEGLRVTCERLLAGWPSWLRDELSPPGFQVGARVTVPDNHALKRLVRLIVGAHEGERNNLTYWVACRVGEMVRSGLLRADFAVAVIAEAATRAGLPRAEAERTAWSGIKRTSGLSHA
jgi:Bifunctional DNA primase/polymerase, N-terminal